MHTVRAYHTMIESLAKIRQYQIMWDRVNTMRSKSMLNVETFCIIMRRYARVQKVDEAIYMFNIMEKYGVQPNLPAFNGLLIFCLKGGVGHLICQRLWRSSEKWLIWAVTYGIMVDILCKAGRVDEAIGIVREMDSNGCRPTSFIYSVLVHTYGIENRIEDAVDAFLEMERNGIKADIVVYNALIGAFCKVSKLKNVYRFLNEMHTKGVAPNARTCNTILNTLIGRGETDEAIKVFRRIIKECEPDADTYIIH
ncbi:hypothetical protein COLO4_09903 [Corchorus olitorius]|uniref:Pentacotripeptide-repeat region of PRORP domain-containing protein n=1 Tax=Corchorus olitorius TaxID=93759 RepID=A0A1R3KAM4_9ROSI|nr:hypothetical protein COLO4_09903 [Corchorus olitorius]